MPCNVKYETPIGIIISAILVNSALIPSFDIMGSIAKDEYFNTISWVRFIIIPSLNMNFAEDESASFKPRK
jgi:hypothetical protein